MWIAQYQYFSTIDKNLFCTHHTNKKYWQFVRNKLDLIKQRIKIALKIKLFVLDSTHQRIIKLFLQNNMCKFRIDYRI